MTVCMVVPLIVEFIYCAFLKLPRPLKIPPMSMKPFTTGVLGLFLCARFCAGGEPPTTTQPTSQPPDKWRYSLFDPTPAEQLRGMDTDRPNVTNTPHTIDAGHIQVETGLVDYSYYHARSGGHELRSENAAFGQVELRLGLLNNLEISAATTAYSINSTHDFNSAQTTRAEGVGDTVVGAKLNLWGDDGVADTWVNRAGDSAAVQDPHRRGSPGQRSRRIRGGVAVPGESSPVVSPGGAAAFFLRAQHRQHGVCGRGAGIRLGRSCRGGRPGRLPGVCGARDDRAAREADSDN